MINILIYILLVVEVVISFLLIAVILMQRSKSQGAGVAFGGGMGEAVFGAQMGNVLTRTTVVLGIAFLVNTTFIAVLESKRSDGPVTLSIPTTPVAPATPTMPGGAPIGGPDSIPSEVVPAEPMVPETAIPMDVGELLPVTDMESPEPTVDVPVEAPLAAPVE